MSDENPELQQPLGSPEEMAKNELNDRMNSFVKDYGELVAKHKIDFATYPVYIPDGQGGFKTTIQNTPVDITNSPQKSPFIA